MHNRRISRRQLLRTSGTALLAMNLWPGALAHADVLAPDIEFIAANDFHYSNEKCPGFFQLVYQAMTKAAPKADLCLGLGDMADRNEVAQLTGMRDVLKSWKLDVKVIRGNHDWALTPGADPYKVRSYEGKSFEKVYPGSVNYTFDYRGWQIIALDSTHGPLWRYVEMQPHTLRWLDDNLPKLDRKKPTIVMTHVPPGRTVIPVYQLKNANVMLERLKRFNLKAVLCGHYHAETESIENGILMTTGKCCSRAAENHDGTPEKGFFVCSASDGVIRKRFVEVKVPQELRE